MTGALVGCGLALAGLGVVTGTLRRVGAKLRRGRAVPAGTARARIAASGAARFDAHVGGMRSRLALAGEGKTFVRFQFDRLACAASLAAIPIVVASAVEGRLVSLWFGLPGLVGLALPDLALRQTLVRRRAAVLLALPDMLAMLTLALAAGRSLYQALALAARETPGPLGVDIAAALSHARRDPALGERAALVEVARAGGEPNFVRFAELLAAKESPYVEFLRREAQQARAEHNRLLELAADRAYLAMQAPLAPLLSVLVLLVSYGFLHVLDQST